MPPILENSTEDEVTIAMVEFEKKRSLKRYSRYGSTVPGNKDDDNKLANTLLKTVENNVNGNEDKSDYDTLANKMVCAKRIQYAAGFITLISILIVLILTTIKSQPNIAPHSPQHGHSSKSSPSQLGFDAATQQDQITNSNINENDLSYEIPNTLPNDANDFDSVVFGSDSNKNTNTNTNTNNNNNNINDNNNEIDNNNNNNDNDNTNINNINSIYEINPDDINKPINDNNDINNEDDNNDKNENNAKIKDITYIGDDFTIPDINENENENEKGDDNDNIIDNHENEFLDDNAYGFHNDDSAVMDIIDNGDD